MSVYSASAIQFRVIYALILREIHTLYGHTQLGYLWGIIQTAFSIAVFWGLLLIVHARPPHGLTVLSFLVAGFGIWPIIRELFTKSMKAVEGNKALFTFPHLISLKARAGYTKRVGDVVIIKPNGEVGTVNSLGIGFDDQMLVLPKHDTKLMQGFKDIMQVIYQLVVSTGVVLRLPW